MEEDDSMTTIETSRLIEWLVEHGHTYEEAAECIGYIANQKNNGQNN